MNISLVLAVAGLVGFGVHLITSRSLSRIVLGFALLGHAAVLALLTAGGPAGEPPLADRSGAEDMANPLPQALSLTAIVISFGLTLFLLALARRQHELTGDDLVEDDLEDRAISALAELEEAEEAAREEAERAEAARAEAEAARVEVSRAEAEAARAEAARAAADRTEESP